MGGRKHQESLYSAFRRKEVFATSGPRIKDTLFAGYDFDESMLSATDGIERVYAQGVTMGGTLTPVSSADDKQVVISSAPEFIVMASADPESAPLQRLQIVKGWIDADGTHEKVIDVACAGAMCRSESRDRPLPYTTAAKVDTRDCSISARHGLRSAISRCGETQSLISLNNVPFTTPVLLRTQLVVGRPGMRFALVWNHVLICLELFRNALGHHLSITCPNHVCPFWYATE